jgi:ArsR family transcriptional regulator
MREKVRIFKALSDANRIRILKMLELRPLCVCEITEVLQLATSTVSKHLSILRDVGFITDEKNGKWVNYCLSSGKYNEYIKKLMPMIEKWFSDEDTVKKDAEKAREVDRNILCGI